MPLPSGIWAGAGLQVEELLTHAQTHQSDVSCCQLSSGPWGPCPPLAQCNVAEGSRVLV